MMFPVVLLLSWLVPPAVAQQALVINEFVGSTTGNDVEFVELYGEPLTSLAGLSWIIVESDNHTTNGRIDYRFDFNDTDILGDNGFYLVGNSDVEAQYAVTPNRFMPFNAIENGAYTIALIETSAIEGETNVTNVDPFAVFDACGITDVGDDNSFWFSAPVVGPDGTFLPAGARRINTGVDTDTAEDWAIASFFHGSANTPTRGTFSPTPFPTGPTSAPSPAPTTSPTEGDATLSLSCVCDIVAGSI